MSYDFLNDTFDDLVRPFMRTYPLGFPTTKIRGGKTAYLDSITTVDISVGRLVIPSDVASSIEVCDLQVRGKSIFPTAFEAMPAQLFTEKAIGHDWPVKARISDDITLIVRNTSRKTVTLNACLIVKTELVVPPPREIKKEPAAIPMLLWCPTCGKRHIDEGEFATKPHTTHACQHCGMCWRPAIVPTCGVQFLPGFKNP